MSEGLVGLLVLGGLAAAAALPFHLRTRRFGLVCLLSALVAATAFLAADALRSGYLDPFFPIAWVGAFLAALAVSAGVGGLVRALRARGPSRGP